MTPGGPPGIATSSFNARSRAASGPLVVVVAPACAVPRAPPTGVTASAAPPATATARVTVINSRPVLLTPTTLHVGEAKEGEHDPCPVQASRKQRSSVVTGGCIPQMNHFRLVERC